MIIRSAAVADADVLAELNRHVHEIHVTAEPAIYRDTLAAATSAWFAEILGRDGFECLIGEAEPERQAVAFVLFRVDRRPANPFAHARDRLFVDQLAVAPGARRQGYGRALMQAVHDRATGLGIADVELNVRSFNRAAISFYASLGYDPVMMVLCRRTPAAPAATDPLGNG